MTEEDRIAKLQADMTAAEDRPEVTARAYIRAVDNGAVGENLG